MPYPATGHGILFLGKTTRHPPHAVEHEVAFIPSCSHMSAINHFVPITSVISTYRGSLITRQRVEDQIRSRWGEAAASSYDPHRNCLTFNQWRKQGYVVKRGEKALRSMTLIEKKDKAGKLVARIPKRVALFFHVQVEPICHPEL